MKSQEPEVDNPINVDRELHGERETSNKLTLIKVRNTEDDDRTLIRVWMMWSWMSFENAQTGSK